MRRETYWEKALKQTNLSINNNGLYPLETKVVTDEFYDKDDFIIRKLDTSKFKKLIYYGPKQNPFRPWEKILEIDKIGKSAAKKSVKKEKVVEKKVVIEKKSTASKKKTSTTKKSTTKKKTVAKK